MMRVTAYELSKIESVIGPGSKACVLWDDRGLVIEATCGEWVACRIFSPQEMVAMSDPERELKRLAFQFHQAYKHASPS